MGKRKENMILKSAPKIVWTNHCKKKLRFYRLSQSRVLRVLRHPKRKEEGVAPNTVAAMQPAGSKKHPYEIWVMYQIKKSEIRNPKSETKLKIISVWRYPGVSPFRQPPIQEDDLKFWL
jgi:hypothetical protein